MTTSVRALILRAFDHPSRPSKWWDVNDSVNARGNEVAKLRAVIADLRRDNIRLLGVYAENQRLSAELAARDAENADLKSQADLSARQRNTRMRYFA